VPTRQRVNPWNAMLTLDDRGQPGNGAAVLLLHSEEGPQAAQYLAAGLAQERRVVMPHHPGFDRESRVPGVDRPQELAYLYMDLLDQIGVPECAVVGTSFGAWIGLEMAAMAPARFTSLAAISPVGVKFSGPLDRTFAEVLIGSAEQIRASLYHDPSLDPWNGMTDPDDVVRRAEYRESFLHYAWEPYLYNPKLVHLLPRITAPSLVVIGKNDRFVNPEYYPAFAKLLPASELEIVGDAGHFPDIEQPSRTLESIQRFLAKFDR
jgi:pimeloyl-ACP methyl ester carboxylesterase